MRISDWSSDVCSSDRDASRPLEVRVTPPYQRGYAMAMLAAHGPYDPTAKTYFDVMPMDDYTPAQADSFLREYNHWLMQILAIRSEEHTSELQSLMRISYAVFCLTKKILLPQIKTKQN